MEIDDVRAFVAVVDTGSVSRAAGELHLTQPAVSRRVRRLEEAIGAALLDRRSRPFALTHLGRAALVRCRHLLSTAHELNSLAADGSVPAGELRIGVAHALSEPALFEPVDRVRRAFPRVVPMLRTGWSRELVERVRSGGLDAAVVLMPGADRLPARLKSELLGRERLLVVASRRWRRRPRRIDDLRDVGWVLNPEGCAARAWLQQRLGAAGTPFRVNVEAYSYELQLSLVARGRGLGLVPARLLARSRDRSAVRTLRVRGLDFPFAIWLARAEVPGPNELPLQVLSKALRARLARGSTSREVGREQLRTTPPEVTA